MKTFEIPNALDKFDNGAVIILDKITGVGAIAEVLDHNGIEPLIIGYQFLILVLGPPQYEFRIAQIKEKGELLIDKLELLKRTRNELLAAIEEA